jgi:hypothetical protein
MLFEIDNSRNCYECGNAPELQSLGRWQEVTETEYRALLRIVLKNNQSMKNVPLVLVTHNPGLQSRVIASISDFIKEEEAQEAKEEELKEQKRLQKLANKEAKTKADKRKLLEQLKSELGE